MNKYSQLKIKIILKLVDIHDRILEGYQPFIKNK